MLSNKIRIIMISIKSLPKETFTTSIEQICIEKRSDSRIMPSVLSTLATFSVSSSSFSSGRSGKARRNVTLNCYNMKVKSHEKKAFWTYLKVHFADWAFCDEVVVVILDNLARACFIKSNLISKIIIFSHLLWSSLLTPLEAKLVFLAM